MKADYKDIRSKIKEEPLWYDENGVPRYAKFHPKLSPNIYADEVILLEIACQDCGKRFFVEMNWDPYHSIWYHRHSESFRNRLRIWLRIKRQSWCPIHYGDPPNHRCTGDTMNCIDLRIVEFWERGEDLGWKRNRHLEITLEKEKNY